MAQTIPGGAYQNADGTWVDANGKPLSSRAVEQFKEVKAEQRQALQQAEQALLQSQLTPLPTLVNDQRAAVSAVTPQAPNEPDPSEETEEDSTVDEEEEDEVDADFDEPEAESSEGDEDESQEKPRRAVRHLLQLISLIAYVSFNSKRKAPGKKYVDLLGN